MFSRNLQGLNAFCLLVGLSLCFILVFQIRQLYDNRLKYNRFLGYKQFVQEISSQMSEVERSVNKSISFIHQLNEALLRQHDKKQKVSTQGKMISPS